MNLFYRPIFPFFVLATFFALFLAGCLDAPDYPHALEPVESINVMVKQKKSPYSTLLKVNPSDSATITAKTVPEKIQDDLTFKWFYVSDSKDSLLIQGADYTFYPNNLNESIPNKLVVLDKEGNQQVYEFTVVINTPPVLSDSTIPANGDTLYGSPFSAFLFSWSSMDLDLYSGDTLFHILEIDGKQYDVGTLLEVKQSGFKAGKHKFRIIVRDLYGDTDTLPYKNFYVVDTLEVQ